MNPIDVELWEDTRRAEIATTSSQFTADAYIALCERYARLGLHEETIRLSRRLMRLKKDVNGFLPFVLEALAETNSLKDLSAALSLAISQQTKSPALRRALAKAHHVMGQIDAAAQEWRTLLDNGDMSGDDWLAFARFTVEHGDVQGLGARLEYELPCVSEGHTRWAARLCAVCYHIHNDITAAESQLKEIPPDAFEDVALSFALAVLAFRTGDYGYAETAAGHALEKSPGDDAVESLLATIRAFAENEAPQESIHVAPKAVKALQALSDEVPPDCYTWGIFTLGDRRSVNAARRPFQHSEERFLEDEGNSNVLFSFSCLPVQPRDGASASAQRPDPLEVLPYLDFEVPHLMLQRFSDGEPPRMHAFVTATGHPEWCWKPMKPIVSGEADRRSRMDRDDSACREGHLWEAAAIELRRFTTRED